MDDLQDFLNRDADIEQSEKEPQEPQNNQEQEPQEPESGTQAKEPEPEKFDEVTVLKKHFGDRFKSFDDVKGLVDSSQEQAQYAQELKKKYEDLQSNSFNNPNYKKLDILEGKSKEKAKVFQRYLMGDLDNEELVKLGLIYEYPELAENKKLLERQIRKKFPELYQEEVDPESQEYQDAMQDMEFEAKQVEKKLKNEFEEIEIPTKNQEKAKQSLMTWNDEYPKLKEDFSKFKVTDGKEEIAEIEIPKGELESYLKMALNYIYQNEMSYSGDNAKKIKEFVKGLYIANNLEKYNSEIAKQLTESINQKWREGVHNPEGAEQKPPKGGSEPDPDKELSSQLF